MNEKLVSVIVVDYHGSDVLEKCLQSVVLSSYPALEVIVVDNANDVDTKRISKKFGVTLLISGSNIGYSGGNNFGVEHAHGEFVLFLNNDATLHPDAISRLVEEANRSKATLCVPKIFIMSNPGVLNSAGIQIHMAGFGILRGCGEKDLGQYDKNEGNCFPHGACLFASKKGFQNLGCFDKHFFAFNEDTDLGWKALLMGRNVRYVSSAIVYHEWGHTYDVNQEAGKIFVAERNRLIMVLTNYQRRTLILLLPVLILAECSTLAYCLVQGMLGSKIEGYVDLLKLRKYILIRRKWIESVRTTSDGLVIKSFILDYKHTLLGRHNKPINILFHILGDFLKHFVR
jgi:GT2 family glycosyltransferase